MAGMNSAESETMAQGSTATPSTTSSVRLTGGRAAAIVALALFVLALLLRLWGLGTIHELIFDETYYVKDAYTLSHNGVEMVWPEDPDAAFERGDLDGYERRGAYVVHPPLGKWIIASGMAVLGADSPWGWRIAVALLGSLSVPLLFQVGRRLFRSTLIGAIAGLLLAVDGLHIVQSRTALLDLPLSFFCLAAFAALLRDRDVFRDRLLSGEGVDEEGADEHRQGRRLRVRRPWRLLAGVLLGMACAVKWSGLYMLAVFGILTVLWDWWARRQAQGGERTGALAARWLRVDAVPAFVAMVGSALVVYILSWSGWFASSAGYMRRWAEGNGRGTGFSPVDALLSLWHYHQATYGFHVELDAEHPYSSNPLTWPLMLRPVNYYYEGVDAGSAGCRVQECAAQVLALGNPLLWWSGAIAMVVAVVLVLWRRDGRAVAALSGVAGGWLPWLLYMDRTVFAFYAVVFEPWMVLCLAWMFGLLIGPAAAGRERRLVGTALATALLVAIILVSAFFWPLWSGQVIDLEQWHHRMWLTSWV